MKKYLALFSLALLVVCGVGCRKDEITESLKVQGRYVICDDGQMSDSFLEFIEGDLKRYESDESFAFAEKTLWHSSVDEFEVTEQARYSITGGKLYKDGVAMGDVNVAGDSLCIGDSVYYALEKFTQEYYSYFNVQTQYNFTEGGTQSFQYKVLRPLSGAEVTASTEDAWIENLTVNDGNISFSSEISTEERKGTVTLACKGAEDASVAIVQGATTYPVIKLEETEGRYKREGQQISFAYEVLNPTFGSQLTASANVNWIKNIRIQSGKIYAYITEVSGDQERTGVITLSYPEASDVDYTVIQTSKKPVIKLTQTTGTVTAKAQEIAIDFTVEDPYTGSTLTATASSTQWVKNVRVVDNQVIADVLANTTSSERKVTFTLKYPDAESVQYTLTQGVSPVINLTATSATVSSAEQKYTIKYNVSNPVAGTTVSVTSSASWAQVSSTPSTSSGNVVISVSQNTAAEERVATITFKYAGAEDAVFTLTQNPKPIIKLPIAYGNYSSDLQTIKFKYTITYPVDLGVVTCECSENWITGIVALNGTVSANLTKYEQYLSRSGTITLKYPGADNVTFKVTQCGEAKNLDGNGSQTANCYLVNSVGSYSFHTYKGNSKTSVGKVDHVHVLWQSRGTATAPGVGSLISAVRYSDGVITFSTGETFLEGNALIVAYDLTGNILWSWHIWFVDDYNASSNAQSYKNDAGTMMDRNLGASSASSEYDLVGTLGLLYQWGRKDPFLASCSMTANTRAAFSSNMIATFPKFVESTSETGTVAYSIAHPDTFIKGNSYNYDWYYGTNKKTTDYTRWSSTKTIYDPCPYGWRVPDGGTDGIWATASGHEERYQKTSGVTKQKGIDFKEDFMRRKSSSVWYPFAGCIYYTGEMINTGTMGYNWSVTPANDEGKGAYVYLLVYGSDGYVAPARYDGFGLGSAYSVRCVKDE